MSPYTFTVVEKKDLDMLEVWLSSPEVLRWFPDPDYIDDLEEGLSDSRIRMMIVHCGEKPFGFLQHYDIHGWKDHHLSYLAKGSRGIDTFIGVDEMLGHGHGQAYIKCAVDALFRSGIPEIGIDPDIDNARAIAVYKKVGFTANKISHTEYGRLQLMSLKCENSASS